MLNAQASRAAKSQGMQLALDYAGDDWRTRVLEELRTWCSTQREQGATDMTLEQFRAVAKAHPGSTKAWGAIPALAVKAGILAPLLRDDGSQVMRPAESVKTHGHFVRVWRLLPAASSSCSTGARAPTTHDSEDSQARRQCGSQDGRGAVLHGGGGAELLAATSDYHRERARTEAA